MVHNHTQDQESKNIIENLNDEIIGDVQIKTESVDNFPAISTSKPRVDWIQSRLDNCLSSLDKRLSRLDWIQSNLRQKILEIENFFNAQNSSYIYY